MGEQSLGCGFDRAEQIRERGAGELVRRDMGNTRAGKELALGGQTPLISL